MIINIGNVYPSVSINPTTPPQSTPPTVVRHGLDGDTFELSRAGAARVRAAEKATFLLAKTRAIRAQIEAGTYETPERINGTVDRLIDVIA
jgi:hypothetical protein